jgi:predicted nucleic acid-binding protein
MADKEEIKKLNEGLEELQFNLQSLAGSLTERLNNNLSSATTEAERLVDAFEKGENVTKQLGNQLKKIQTKNNELSLNRVKLESDLARAQKQNLSEAEKKIRLALYQNKLAIQQLDNTTDLLLQLKRVNKEKEKENDITKALTSSLAKELGATKLLSSGALTLTGIFTFLVAAAIKADDQTTKLAKSLTLTKTQAAGVREQFVAFSVEIGDASVTTGKLLESFSKLTQQLGFNVPLSKTLLKEFTTLTKNIGISEESAAGLAKITLATGKDARQVTTEALGTAQALEAQNGIQLSNKEVLEDIGKVSGQLLANFKANPIAIAAAVTQAKLLGTNLETVKKQGEALLNFESSIQNELEAELLTGQALNLEKARAAALSGDQLTVMKELNSQNVDFNKFSNMNVLAQQSLAKSLGLSSDELSDQLLKQQYLGKSRAEVAALGGEEVAQRLEQLSVQDKFNNAIEKLQDLVGNLVAGPFGQLLDVIVDIASGVGYIFSIFQKLLGNSLFKIVMGGIGGLIVSGGNPLGALAGAAIAGIGAAQATNDMYSGYGQRVLSTPQGSYALNNSDTVIAGTNLFKGDDVLSLPKNALSIGGGNSALLEAISGLRNDLQNPKPIMVNNVINNNIERAGTAMYGYSYKAP